MDRSIAAIAAIAHEANRAWCEHLGDTSQTSWDDAPDWQKESAINGVMFHAANPNAGDDASHNSWSAEKIAAGWIYGKVKDPEASPPTHPCLVPFEELPADQRFKDTLFRTVVRAALDFNDGQGGLALDELTRLGQHVVDVGYEPAGGASIVDSAIEVIDSLRYGNPRYRADLGITRAEIARRGMAEDAEGTAIDIIDKLGWPGIEYPQGKPATHALVPLQPIEVQVKQMADRFLGWKLPETFNPDCGISFNPPSGSWPTGTNLFTAVEAEGMVRHMLDVRGALAGVVEADGFDETARAALSGHPGC